jgi:UDP-glucose 4-epimerase
MSTLVLGAGLIGSLTAQQLLAAGEDVVLADVRAPKTLPAGAGRLTALTLDVTDVAALMAVATGHGVQRIVHTAALLSTAIRQDPLNGIKVNVMGTANVLECARRLQLKRVVLASSTTLAYNTFGQHGPQAMEEDVPMRLLSERPASIYAATKLAGEHLALLYSDLYGVDTVSLRYGAVLGGDLERPTSVPGRLIQTLVQAARTGQTCELTDPLLLWGGREEFVDARDCARANVCALHAPEPKQRVYNVASGDWFTLGEFVRAMQGEWPQLQVHLPPEPDTGFAGFPNQRPSPSSVAAAQLELGFQTNFTLGDSLAYWCRAASPSVPH